jgi:2-polyprenyl-3-methyl-5-hydroxy-6-metoxy-1,4-benzoquinol methylase
MFKNRSYQKELLDETDIETSLLFQNLKELAFINSYLGGHSISIKAIQYLVTNQSKTDTIIDIGCGGGDSIKAIANWAKNNNEQIQLTGIDLKQDCIDYATTNCIQFPEIKFTCDDFRNAFNQPHKIDVVHAALFCHHFTENELVGFIQLCNTHKAIFIINDLERNPIAYYAIKILTHLFSKSPLVKNDAPLSVLKGFKKTEWKAILERANSKNYVLKNRWAFRHLLIIYPNE